MNSLERDASASLASSLKALLTENFATLRGRGSAIGVWKQRPDDECGFGFDFFSITKVKDLDPALYRRVEKSFSADIPVEDRLSERDIVVLLKKKEQFGNGPDESDLWWIRKRSAAATFISLDLPVQELARRSAKTYR